MTTSDETRAVLDEFEYGYDRWGMAEEIVKLRAAIARGVEDGTLDCVVRGKTCNDGRPAPECPEIISRPEAMCAGCRIRTVARFPRRPEADQ